MLMYDRVNDGPFFNILPAFLASSTPVSARSASCQPQTEQQLREMAAAYKMIIVLHGESGTFLFNENMICSTKFTWTWFIDRLDTSQ